MPPGEGGAAPRAHDREALARRFHRPDVTAAYGDRAPYPPELDDILLDLLGAGPPVVLDLGSGPGVLARRLAPRVRRVDALDVSAAMIDAGGRSPGGAHPAIRWICRRAEDFAPDCTYGLVIAGKSLHWMSCDIVLPRLRTSMSPGGVLAVVRSRRAIAWRSAEKDFLRHYAVSAPRPDIVAETARTGLFEPLGERLTPPMEVRQPLGDYINSFHSMEAFCSDDLGPARTAEFRAGFREVLTPYTQDGELVFTVQGRVTWGRPT